MLTVLLAEADRDLRETYLCFLSRHGYQVDTADDGLECLDKLRRSVPDLLILDLELPWGGGDGVLALLREHEHLLPDRVVLTSAVATDQVLDNLASPPVVQALRKPFLLSTLHEHGAFFASDEPKLQAHGIPRRGILVVSDEPAVRDVLERHLQSAGFRVWTAGSGEEALDHCCDHGEEIAVILLNVQMPGLDGSQTLEGIRELDPSLPVCFMTGDPGDHEPGDLLQQGARHVFRKPFRVDEIIDVVRNLANEPKGWPQEV